jgi:RNA polymerase sigma-70 factor (ECF subfamily)
LSKDDKAQGFKQEALPHLDAIYRFALRLTGSPADAEDLVQETVLRTYRSWHHYTRGTRAKSWLFAICRNAFLRQRQQENRRREVTQQVSTPEAPLFVKAHRDDPEGVFFFGIVDQAILDHITRFQQSIVKSFC